MPMLLIHFHTLIKQEGNDYHAFTSSKLSKVQSFSFKIASSRSLQLLFPLIETNFILTDFFGGNNWSKELNGGAGLSAQIGAININLS
jgi:hypothetical protein